MLDKYHEAIYKLVKKAGDVTVVKKLMLLADDVPKRTSPVGVTGMSTDVSKRGLLLLRVV